MRINLIIDTDQEFITEQCAHLVIRMMLELLSKKMWSSSPTRDGHGSKKAQVRYKGFSATATLTVDNKVSAAIKSKGL